MNNTKSRIVSLFLNKRRYSIFFKINYFIACISFFIFLTGFIILFMKINSLYVHQPLKYEVKDLNDGYFKDSWIKEPSVVLTNSYGLMNKMYRGEKNRIAFLGGCNFNRLNFFPDHVKTYFEDTYIETYLKAQMSCKPAIQKLKKMKHHYKSIFILTLCGEIKNFPIEIMFSL